MPVSQDHTSLGDMHLEVSDYILILKIEKSRRIKTALHCEAETIWVEHQESDREAREGVLVQKKFLGSSS